MSVTDSKDTQGNDDQTIDNTIQVTINVIDDNEAPEITGATTTDWAENATGTVARYTARDPESATTTWTVHGTDAAHFGITRDDGELYIETVPNYEGKRFYQVRVQVTDGSNIADLEVTITITNVEEPGTVTLSPTSPEVGTPVNAHLTDPDLFDSITGWSWHRSPDKISLGSPIAGATGSAYTPGNADEGNYLRATASYDDGHAVGKSASGVSDTPVPTTNSQPTFSPDIVRSVDENTEAGEPIGDPVKASDDETDDTLTYSLGGDDAAHFDIATSTGQLKTVGPLDFEDKASYSVTVSVSDGKNVDNNADDTTDATIPVTVNVNNVNEDPELTGTTTASFDENAVGTVATFTAEDPEENSVSWDVSGTDAGAFEIVDGKLTFKSPPDYEAKQTYQVTVMATDGPNTVPLDVTVTINNIEEPGKVTLSPANPTVGAQVKATLADPDGSLSDITWTWETSDGNNWTPVKSGTASNAASDSYIATTTDQGKSLRVSATYTDGEASGKNAEATSASAVGAEIIVNTAPVFGPDTTRSVEENTAASEVVGLPVTATDAEHAGEMTYTLGGTDASSFDITLSTGQIFTKDPLDRENKDTYTVTVTATDPAGAEDTTTVTITVSDVDEPPEFTSGPDAISYAETATGPVATYAARDPEEGQVVWDKAGDDGTHFSVINGALTFNAQPDYDDPRDKDKDNVYHVTVVALVTGSTSTASQSVTVTVTPKNEPPQFPNGDTGVRSVTENTAAGQNVGAPVSASDPENDDLFYWLSGRDARSFDIHSSTGQILAKSELNYEGRKSYTVTVSVRDSLNVDGNTDAVTDDTIDHHHQL